VNILLPAFVGLAGVAVGAWLWRLAASVAIKTVLVVVSVIAVFFLTTEIGGEMAISAVQAKAGELRVDVEGAGETVWLVPVLGIWGLGALVGAAMLGVAWGLGCGALWLVALGLGAMAARWWDGRETG
jgi:hypothetical protein